MPAKSIPDLSSEVVCRILTHVFEPCDASVSSIRSATLACKDLARAWEALKSNPQEHGLLSWLLAVRPDAAASTVLKLGLGDPEDALRNLAGLESSEDLMCRYSHQLVLLLTSVRLTDQPLHARCPMAAML